MKNKWKIAITPLEIKQKNSKIEECGIFQWFLPVWGIFKALDKSLSSVAKIENESFRIKFILD